MKSLKNILTKKLGAYDWKLLLFLVLVMNVKLVIKVVAIILIYVLRPDFKFNFRLKSSRLPLFYLLVIGIAIINYLLYAGFRDLNYSMAFCMGLFYWALCILAVHQVKLSVERSDADKVHATLVVFFILNILASFINLLSIIIETGAINPYTYQGLYQKYFIDTGDHIRGISFDTSTTNAVLNAFGVVYFLKRKQFLLALLCMAALLLTGSNFINVILLLTLIYLFIFQSRRDEKSILFVCVCFLVLFMSKVSPQNFEYSVNTFQNMFHSKTTAGNGLARGPGEQKKPGEDDSLSDEGKKYKIAHNYLDSLTRSTSIKTDIAAKDTQLVLIGRTIFCCLGSSSQKAKQDPVNPGNTGVQENGTYLRQRLVDQ